MSAFVTVTTPAREEWRCIIMEFGAPFVMTRGTSTTQWLYAVSWDIVELRLLQPLLTSEKE